MKSEFWISNSENHTLKFEGQFKKVTLFTDELLKG